MGDQGFGVTKDYTDLSLDEYIKKNPQVLNGLRKTGKLRKPKFNASGGPRAPFPSQQWRLGRNGPRPLKRLTRSGPLRPLHHSNFNNDGLPRLVVKRYSHLRADSVFHRLGWNPLYTIARRRVRQARDYLWQRRFNYQPRQRVISLPMGRRPMYLQHRNPWSHMWGRPNYQRGQQRNWQQYPVNNKNEDFQNQQLIRKQRLYIQQNKLRRMQSNFQQTPAQNTQPGSFNYPRVQDWSANQPGMYGQMHANQNNQSYPRDTLEAATSSASASQYPIARDEYLPFDRNVRAPSPEGSIISAFSRADANPFARPANKAGGNPFAQRAQENTAPVARPSNYRLIPNFTNVPINERFSNHGGNMMRPLMVDSMME